jgi:hypothetical protein
LKPEHRLKGTDMDTLRLGSAVVGLAMLLAGCASAVGDADAGPNPGGGFYGGHNLNVGEINPPSFYQGQTLAEGPR